MEESPSVFLPLEVRKKMQSDAYNLIKSMGYFGTATVEFIMDPNNQYYFLEVNTRLQVEHTVTEMITGLDLVDLQLDIAEGKQFSLSQHDIMIKGHAMQWRVYAEDANNHFAPSTGTIELYEEPKMKNVRIDSGYKLGSEVPIYYDPMISKIIAWAENRSSCVELLKNGLLDYTLEGIITSIPFGISLLYQPSIKEGKYAVDYLDKNLERILFESKNSLEGKAAAALALYLHDQKNSLDIGYIQTDL